MAEKISKTARASMADRATAFVKPCPDCGTKMIATKVIKSKQMNGGMYWVCPNDDKHFRI